MRHGESGSRLPLLGGALAGLVTLTVLFNVVFKPSEESPARAAPPDRTLEVQELLRVGAGSSGGFGMVVVGVLLPDGGAVILDAMPRHVIRLDPRGELLPPLLGAGAGPYEALNPVAVGLHGDSLWVLDADLNRITLLALSGRGGRMVSLAGLSSVASDGLPLQARAQLNHGRILALPHLPSAVTWPHGPLASQAIVLVDLEEGEVHEVARASVRNGTANFRDPGREGRGGIWATQPFAATTLVAPQRDGSGVVVVERDPEVVGPGRAVVSRYSATGEPLWVRELAFPPLTLTDVVVDSVVRDFGVRLMDATAQAPGVAGPTDARDAEAWIRAGLHLPDHLPAVTHAVGAGDGSIWVREADPGSDPVSDIGLWHRWDGEVEELWRVRLPAGAMLLDARGPILLTRELGSWNEHQVVFYRIEGG